MTLPKTSWTTWIYRSSTQERILIQLKTIYLKTKITPRNLQKRRKKPSERDKKCVRNSPRMSLMWRSSAVQQATGEPWLGRLWLCLRSRRKLSNFGSRRGRLSCSSMTSFWPYTLKSLEHGCERQSESRCWPCFQIQSRGLRSIRMLWLWCSTPMRSRRSDFYFAKCVSKGFSPT